MKAVRGRMRVFLIAVITLQILAEGWITALPQGSSTDPCEEAPCGKGAECKSMGSIAICVCPNDGTGDPFVSCMQRVENENGSSTIPTSSDIPGLNKNQFVASFDVGSIHQQSRNNPTLHTTTAKPFITSGNTTSSQHNPSTMTSSTTTTTTTRSPYVHVFEASTSRPATIGYGHRPSDDDRKPHMPESHKIPIINQDSNNHYPHHEYPPRPISGISTFPPSNSHHHYAGSNSNPSPSYNLFNEKTVVHGSGPIPDYVGGTGTTPYMYRGTVTHVSGSQSAYEYDSRPITPTIASHHYSHNSPQNFGHHSYHPSSSGFPDSITESTVSFSRYEPSSHGGLRSSQTDSTYDIYNYNPMRNDLSAHGSGGFERVSDPLGKYDNCRSVNGIIVCADINNSHSYHSQDPPAQLYDRDRGEIKSTTVNNYGFHSYPVRNHYSSYYPSRHPSFTSRRPTSEYPTYDVNRQGYPHDYHPGPRQPIESHPTDSITSSYYTHSFLPKEQRISAQSVLTISSSSSSPALSTSTMKKATRNDNDHPLCKSMCGLNSICRLVLDRPVCGCPEGHTGDPAVRCVAVYGTSGGNIGGTSMGADGDHQCDRHVDCEQSEICAKNKCIDPCKEPGLMSSSSVNFIGVGGSAGGGTTICGANAECLVVGHTPVCKCQVGNFGNPYVACVP